MRLIAQTHLQLLQQLKLAPEQWLPMQRAYFHAQGLAHDLYRGSGKPFVCHLVGTASIVAYCHAPLSEELAAMLHACYQERVYRDHPGGLVACRRQIQIEFGPEVERLVYQYQFGVDSNAGGDGEARAVELLHLADDLEDLLDLAPLLHGMPGDDASFCGSADWRLQRALTEHPRYCQRANDIGQAWLADEHSHWLHAAQMSSWPKALRSGARTSVAGFTRDWALGVH